MSLYVLDSVTELMKQVLREYHQELIEIQDQIAVVMREKAKKTGGVVVLGKSSKASDLIRILGRRDDLIFIIELAGDEWVNLDDFQKTALLDHCLCGCMITYDEEKDEVKYSIRKPDLFFYREEAARWGVWRNLECDDDKEKKATEEATGKIESVLFQKD